MSQTRDPMVLKEGDTYYCYYTSHLEKDDPAFPIKSAIFCRTSKDLITWSEPKLVSDGGSAAKQTGWYGGDAECPFVVKVHDRYILFRNQRYGRNHLNTQYCSADPLHFGIDSDQYLVGQLPVAAPEIIKIKDQYYIVALKPGLDGMRMAKLKFVKKEVAAAVKSRISWDESTLQKVSASGKGYCGYARLIQLQDRSLLCTYEADGSVVVAKSSDGGKTWSPPITVAPRENGFNMAVPDLLQLKDGSVLICYNPRPYQQSTERKFAIRTKKSYDSGLTWKDERLLYEAGHEFKNGCWEPSAIQLPGGEIQLYFANEGVYLNSNEQNISLLRSRDNGLTWTTPEMVSFRSGYRDGMPVPVLLQNGKEIVYAIEDNGVGNFKPYIIRTRVEANWSAPVLSDAADRNYALAEKIPDSIYAGAPYLRQLSTGETILSYQGTEGRPNKMNNAEMKVVIGTADARNFTNKTSPFKIPPSRSGLWNSVSIIDKDVVVALTSTNAFSENGATEVWMIKGRVIR